MIHPYKSRQYDESKPVRVYRNLNRKGFILSLQQKIDGRWLVIGHTAKARLTKVTTYINEPIRDRVRVSKKKTPHAYLIAEKVSDIAPHEASRVDLGTLAWVSYNPYNDVTFVRTCYCDGRVVKTIFTKADNLLITNNKIFEL